MLDRRDPEFPALRANEHWRLDREYLSGTIGEATYLRSLFLIGIRDDEARQALRECNAIKARVVDYEERRIIASREWLIQRTANEVR